MGSDREKNMNSVVEERERSVAVFFRISEREARTLASAVAS